MTNAQMYFAIAVPAFTVLVGMLLNILVIVWQARGIERRLDKIESRLTTIEQDYKIFFQEITRIKSKVGL